MANVTKHIDKDLEGFFSPLETVHSLVIDGTPLGTCIKTTAEPLWSFYVSRSQPEGHKGLPLFHLKLKQSFLASYASIVYSD